MKKIISFLLAFSIAITSFLAKSDKIFADNEPNLTAQYAVLMDFETGKVLYDKNGSQKLYPASTTKAWTAYVVLKHVSNLSEVVKIENLPTVDGSSMYLRNGESFTVRQLLDGLLVHSSNDVAVVLANYVSGSIEKFAELMNKEAEAVGAKNTHFNNPHGLPDENHYTTAYDMALMSREAMNNDVFRDIVKTKSISFPATQEYPYERYFLNTNKFLTSNEKMNYKGKEIPVKYDLIDGIKTGYTDAAGKCLLSSGIKNNMRLISAVFKTSGNDLYMDSRTLIDYGFDNFKSETVIKKDDHIDKKNVFLSKQGKLVYEPKYSYKVVLPKNSKSSNYKTKTKLNKINLPIKKGDVVGKLEVYNSNDLEHSIDLIAVNDVNSIFSFITENKIIMSIIKLIVLLFVLFIIFIIFIIIKKKNRRRNRRKYIYNKSKNKHRRRNRRR